MAIEKVRAYFSQFQLAEKIMEFEVSSATVELAAQAVNCVPARIAKTLSFRMKSQDKAILVVTAGDAKVNNAKYKAQFGEKAVMLSPEEVTACIGHSIGGVCPFGIKEGVSVYLDVSLKRFSTVFPACGSSNSAIELTMAELETYSNCMAWVDVCNNWQ